MRIGIISDTHGDLLALEAVLSDLQHAGVDGILCLGDVALFGPQPRDTLAAVIATGCAVVMGNGDQWLLDPQLPAFDARESRFARDIKLWCAAQLTAGDLDLMKGFAPTIEMDLDGVRLIGFHGSPRSNEDLITSATPERELAEMTAGVQATVLAGGHTHIQMLRRFSGGLIVNPGSVHCPIEPGRVPGAFYGPPWAEYGVITGRGDRLSVDLHRVPVDIDRLEAIARARKMPHIEWYMAPRRR